MDGAPGPRPAGILVGLAVATGVWALALGACLGGNGTLVGASANLTVAGIAERNGVAFRFWPYTRRAFPLMLLTVALAHRYLVLRDFS